MASLLNGNNNDNDQSWSTHENETNEDTNNNTTQSSQPVRKRTRATADQLSVLEDTFAVNVSPNSKLRKQLAEQLQMSERSIQIWFQNRRAKVKHMQKRAQMQMHQASVRAQLYQYQQQQQTYGVQQQHQQPLNYYFNPTAVNHHGSRMANNMPRAQSVDAIQHYHRQQMFMPPPPPPSHLNNTFTPPPVMFYPNTAEMSRQSMPPYDLNDIGLEFPEYLHGPSPSPSPIHSLKSSTIPTLIPVPDAGPTVVLATANNDVMNKNSKKATSEVEEVWISSPDSVNETINPSNLVMSKNKEKKPATINEEDEEDEEKEPKDLYLSTTTLTVGTWHRLRMNETDLVCVYRPDTRTFAWHIVDGGCHFKMEVTQDAVSSIEYVSGEHDGLAEVHFDISEPPLFYMESTAVSSETEEKEGDKKRKSSTASLVTPVWVQCSDFTEGKQASRFFRHTLKGLQHHLKQELLALIQNHEETRRLVHFIEQSSSNIGYPIEYPDLYNNGYVNPNMYWNNSGYQPNATVANEDSLLSCGLYIS